jgi:hypothetical protein
MNNKVTLEGIQAKIKGEVYLVLPDGKSTLCILTLENGYTIKGISACVDAANFDINIGRKIAFEDAIRQIWPLEGYLLAEKMYWDKAVPVATNPPKEWSASHVDGKIVAKRKNARVRKTMDAPWGLKKDGTPKRKPGGPRK